MKIVFLSNFFNHHQASFSKYIDALTDHNYYFIATEQMTEERKQMGWGNITLPDYVLNYQNVPETCAELIDSADVAIIGSAPMTLVTSRLRAGKLTFVSSERLYKNGYQAWKLPVRLWRFWKMYGRYKNLYLLCASAFAPYDFARTRTFVNKAYKWGYFPHFENRGDGSCLIEQKPVNTAEILYVSRLIPLKHPEMPLQVAARLRDDKVPFHLTMVGNGVLKQEIEEMIVRLDLTKYVTMIDSLPSDTVRDYMDKANIFLFTSDRNEGWGAVVNESMGSACAVVAASEIGSVPFLLEDGQNGLIYEGGNIDDLYQKTKQLCLDRAKREKMGMQAYQSVEQFWNAETASKRLLELIEDLKTQGYSDRFQKGPCSKASILKDGWYSCKQKK